MVRGMWIASLGMVWGVEVMGAVNDKRDETEVKRLVLVFLQDLAVKMGAA